MNRHLHIATICLATVLCAAPMAADEIRLTDGRTLNGKILYQNDELILLHLGTDASSTAVTVKRSEVTSVQMGDLVPTNTPSARNGQTASQKEPTYIHIPLRGKIGHAIDNDLLQRALALIRQTEPHLPAAVILEIDSDGGSVETAIEMMATMTVWRHETSIPLVGFVKNRAISAASWLALSCDTVYVSPAASIGGAMIYNANDGPNGSPLGMKLESIFLSGIRGAIEDAGKNLLLAQAMIDPALTVSYAILEDTQPVIWLGEPTDAPITNVQYQQPPQQLVGQNQILTLTAKEAVSTGLASGLATNLHGILSDLGIAPNALASEAPAHVFEQRYHEIESITVRYERLVDSVDKSLITQQGVAPINPVRREDYTQLIRRLQHVRRTISQMKGISKEHEWIAERLPQDLTQDTASVLVAIDNRIMELEQNMPQTPAREKPRIKVFITR